MRMKDDEIQQKLVELETAILKEQKGDLAPLDKSSELSAVSRDTPATMGSTAGRAQGSQAQKSDLQYFGGIGLVLLGLFMLLQHVKLTTGYMTWWGMSPGNSIGFLLFPLLLGIGWIVYNSRSIWGWLIMVVSLVMMVFTIISGLRIFFMPLSALGVIFMLVPLAAGIALVVKGMGGPQGIDSTIRNHFNRVNRVNREK